MLVFVSTVLVNSMHGELIRVRFHPGMYVYISATVRHIGKQLGTELRD